MLAEPRQCVGSSGQNVCVSEGDNLQGFSSPNRLFHREQLLATITRIAYVP
jgi:hypothetical protein